MKLYAIYNKTHKGFYEIREGFDDTSYLALCFRDYSVPWITANYEVAEMIAKGRTEDTNGIPMIPWGDSERPVFNLVSSAINQGEDVRIITFEEEED